MNPDQRHARDAHRPEGVWPFALLLLCLLFPGLLLRQGIRFLTAQSLQVKVNFLCLQVAFGVIRSHLFKFEIGEVRFSVSVTLLRELRGDLARFLHERPGLFCLCSGDAVFVGDSPEAVRAAFLNEPGSQEHQWHYENRQDNRNHHRAPIAHQHLQFVGQKQPDDSPVHSCSKNWNSRIQEFKNPRITIHWDVPFLNSWILEFLNSINQSLNSKHS